MSRTERIPEEAQDITDAMARAAEPMHSEASPVLGKAVRFVLMHELTEYPPPFGVYQAQPPIGPNVRHINRSRGGEQWTVPPPRAA
jgi:hypothetical protein